MTHPTPTPEEFLAQTGVDEDDEPEISMHHLVQLPPDPLTSIAESLRTIATLLEGPPSTAESQAREDYAQLEEEYREIEALHDAKQQLIEQVLEVCKPSTSKLAIRIREVLEPVVAPATEVVTNPAPGDDAPVEEWREYARGRGFEGPDVDEMNRSQIRTMLGVEQPVSEGAGR